MTERHKESASPLLVRHALPIDSISAMQKSLLVANAEDALPSPVKRRLDGLIVNRDTYTTEVGQETTDDN